MATKTSLTKVTFSVPVGGSSSDGQTGNTYTTKDDVQAMMSDFDHLTTDDVQTLINTTLSKIANAENTKY